MTHYKTLQIDPMANQDVVKAAYRALSLKYHPDRNPGSEKTCLAEMQRINNAYSILSDVGRRAVYDQTLPITPNKVYTPHKPDPVRPQPTYSPPPKPETAYSSPKPGNEWDYDFDSEQSPPKPKAKSKSLKYRATLLLESFWGGIKSFSVELWNVYCVMIWPILKWTVFGVFFILIALLGCGGGSNRRDNYDYYNRNRNRNRYK